MSHRFSGFKHFEASSFRASARFAAAIETDYDLHSAIAQVERVCVPLRAKTDHGAGFSSQPGKIDILIAINAHGHTSSSKLQFPADPAPSQPAWPCARRCLVDDGLVTRQRP